MTYYKATRPDGRSFFYNYGGVRIDYAEALRSGKVIRHPYMRKIANQAETYLSISVLATDCTGFSWPCRLFRVEPEDDEILDDLLIGPNKRAVSALRVVEELPAWQVFGERGEKVVEIIDRCKAMTEVEINLLRKLSSEHPYTTYLAHRYDVYASDLTATVSALRNSLSARPAAFNAAFAYLAFDNLSGYERATLLAPWLAFVKSTSASAP